MYECEQYESSVSDDVMSNNYTLLLIRQGYINMGGRAGISHIKCIVAKRYF